MNNIHIYLHYNCKYFIQNTWNNSNIPFDKRVLFDQLIINKSEAPPHVTEPKQNTLTEYHNGVADTGYTLS